jgi:hypothetical protein
MHGVHERMSTNFRPAPESVKLSVKRRLEKTNPGAVLGLDSVQLCPIPHVPFDATVFIYEQNGRKILVGELCKPDLPHIYAAFAMKENAKANAAIIMSVLLSLSRTLQKDPRFARNVITLSTN